MNPDLEHSYVIAGLVVRSEIALPELISGDLNEAEADVEIRIASVPSSLPGAIDSGFEAEIANHVVLLTIPGIARFLISNGCQITIDPDDDAEAKDIRLFLLGSAFGAIYFQRGYLPLHASVIVINGSAVAFTGDSGAGKSTMAAWLNSMGYPLLCDDVCVVRFAAQGVAMAYSAFPRLKLWSDALEAFDIDASGLERDYFRAEKFHVPVSGQFWFDPVPLRHIYVLQFSSTQPLPRIEDISPAKAVPLLRDNTYRYQYISGLGLTKSHFLDCVRLARSACTHLLIRPEQHSTMAECQALIERQMQ